MGIDAARIGLQIRRIFIVSIRASYKSVLKHPVLVGLVCFLIFLYRSFPFLFSLLVSASPVLFCTVILLGTLLSFGEPNIPEIEKANKEVSHEISSLKAGVLGDATTVLEKDENFFVENFVGKRKDAAEEAIGEENWEKNRVSKIERDVGSCDYVQLVDGSSQDIKFEKQVIEQVERDFVDLELEKNREFYKEKQGIKVVLTNGEAIENRCSLVQNVGDETLQVKKDKSAGGFIAAEKGHHLDHELSSWKQVNDDDEEEEEDKEDNDEASDPGSDGAESSSPDASMADIMPMLDELHPLLDEEAPQPVPVSHDGSDAASKRSNKSNESSVGSEDDIENEADEEEDGDDDNDNEEDEEVQEGKEDDSKSAIKWTEADQKNLMDLGTLELERNQRLESLIARRRARRNMSLVAERNLIDLDGADLPLNVPPISTMRRNPFDVPYDDVPGSAPSVLLPRRNPFDLPYDSNEEKPDLKGDSFQQEFSPLQHREPLFCRHESFSVGPSVWGGAKQQRQALRWKPYFVPERLDSEETSYHALQRQLSEASESKISSVLDTESVSSAVEEEDKKLNEDLSQETEMISNLNHASVLVERGSLSSEDIDSVDIENIERRDVHNDGKEITLGDAENHPELDSSLSASGGATGIELNTSVILLRMEPGEEEYSSRSSPSSQSEVDEKISGVRKRSMSPDPGKSQIEESHISTQASLDSAFHFMGEVVGEIQERELVMNPRGNDTAKDVTAMQMSFDSDIHFTSGVEDENRHIEPGFESTGDPIEDSRILTQASSDSDSHFKIVALDNDQQEEPVLEPSGNLIRKSCISIQTSLNSDFHFTSDPVDDNQQKEPVYDSSPHAVEKFLSFSSISSDTQGETSEMGSPPALAEFSGKESEVHTENVGKDTSCQKEAYEGSSKEHSLFENESSSRKVAETEPDVAKVGQLGDNQVFDFQSGENGFMKSELVVERDASEDTVLHALEEQHPLVGDVSVDSKLFSSESKSVEEDVLRMKGISQPEQEEVPSSGFDAEVHSNSSVSSSFEHMPSNDLNLSENDERQPVVVAGQVLEAHPNASSSKFKHVEELSLMKGEDFQFKQDQVHSSSSDAMIGNDLLQDADLKLVSSGSSYQQVPSEAKSSLVVEKQLSWSDISVVEPSINCDDNKSREPSVAVEESTAEVNIANNLHVPEVFNHEASESASVPPEILEHKPKLDEVDFEDNIHDKIVYEDSGHVLEHLDYSARTHRSFIAEENINEDEDEVKEIDEGLLSELDTVGDFSVKEVVGESLHDEQIPVRTMAGIPENNLLPTDSSVPEIKQEISVLEVRSVTDGDLAFKELHEGVDVEEVTLPSMIEDQPVVVKGPGETNSDLRVVEARSLDIEPNTVEATEAGMIQESGSSAVVLDSQEMSTVVPDEPKH